ncbi:MAG TPA: glycosyltransferase family 1 protein, partial [Candidatus Nitrosocosmicus sp.]|nr:glycosyltransferase family 1 protein [Candidatus Nitrosocosmicus sp.]
GIDARLYFQTGVGVYLRNLLYYLQETAPDNILFYAYVMEDESDRIIFNHPNFIKVKTSSRWHTFSEQLGFVTKLLSDNLDLMHFTYFSQPLLYNKKFIATVHDTTLLPFKTGKASTKSQIFYEIKHFAFRKVFNNQIKNAINIITPTQTVKQEILDVYGPEYQDKIFPIYEGVNYELMKATENTNLKNLYKKDFCMYIGNFYPHKNVERLIKAFSKVEGDIQLILIGSENYFSGRILKLIHEMNLKHRIIFCHTASENELAFFYKNAKALIQPSLSEGFGLPLLEAAYFNCPIIASDIPVFKELLEDNYVTFNPLQIKDISQKINQFLKSPLTFNYKKIIQKYTFQKMAAETLQIYMKNV